MANLSSCNGCIGLIEIRRCRDCHGISNYKIRNTEAKEKAIELYRKYRGFNNETEEINKTTAIQCAELCVDEIMLSLSKLDFEMIKSTNFWIDVKIELNNI